MTNTNMNTTNPTSEEIIDALRAIELPGNHATVRLKVPQFLFDHNTLFTLRSTGATFTETTLNCRLPRGTRHDRVKKIHIGVDFSTRRRRQYFAFTREVDLTRPDWRAKLVQAVRDSYEILPTVHATKEKLSESSRAKDEAKIQFAKDLSEALGVNVYPWKLTTDATGYPCALKVELTISGTVAEIVRKYQAVTAVK